MNYIGIDLHRKRIEVHVHNDITGEVFNRNFENDPEVLRPFFASYQGDCQIVVEATGNWYWLVDMLEDLNLPVKLANPVQTKAIAYAKVVTDKISAKILADLLRADLIPTCWIPKREERNIREMLRIRCFQVQLRTQLKNLVRSVFGKLNITTEHKAIWGVGGRKELENLTLKEPYDQIVKQALSIINILTKNIDGWEKMVLESTRIPEVYSLLRGVPGIGPISALTILYETGPIERFPCAKRYVSYAGLAPTTKGSAGKFWTGHLSRQANLYLKWIYVEVATAAIRARFLPFELRSFYRRTLYRKGKFVAKVALARKIAGVVYHILRDKIDYTTFLRKNSRDW